MRKHKIIAYEQMVADRKFKKYKIICAGIGILFVGGIVILSILK